MILPSPVIAAHSNRKYRLAEPYALSWGGWYAHIEAGWVFDGASIPRLLWRVVGHPWQGLVLPAAAVHDALYATHYTTRAQADELFYRLLLANGVGKVKAWTMYQAVRTFGGLAWSEPSEYEKGLARRRVVVVPPPQEPEDGAMKAMLLVALAGLMTATLVACRMQVTLVNGNPDTNSVSVDMDARKDVGVSPAVGVAMPGGSASADSVSVRPSVTAAPPAPAQDATPTTPTARN